MKQHTWNIILQLINRILLRSVCLFVSLHTYYFLSNVKCDYDGISIGKVMHNWFKTTHFLS